MADGHIVPIWEEVDEKDVATLKETMEAKSSELSYSRIPITSERPPDFHDVSE